MSQVEEAEDHHIRCHLSTLMGKRKVRVADVAEATGIHRNLLTLLYREKAKRVDLLAVEKLCRYFDVTVGELFELEAPDTDSRTLERGQEH